ncbi:hypothetical protein [Wenxinia saemankumensis]|uniref:Uncharacterized protein n=1 Tax=Wenxinia saemankumensis TaxID=1447782 RepID=A0A1M6CUN7_9RHOB|nr:hypothetical protein [Wenxinia saemankumensis]SHI64514.1 hypothetical protein SAMN05444417_1365 [Wenxinia saemankumensis]
MSGTALSRYARLECPGLWRPSHEAQRRDVTVSFGQATLVISDSAGRPLTHWSLPAVERLNPGEDPALYGPDREAGETLELSDATMIDAIETVRKSLDRARRHPGRLRQVIVWGGGALAVVAIALWLPSALLTQALGAVPETKRSEIGAILLGHLQRVTGPACRNPLGTEALARLHERVMGPDAPGQAVVLPAALPGPLYLPGGLIVLSRRTVETASEPSVVAGQMIAAVNGPAGDPMAPILRAEGLRATVTLLTTGDLPDAALATEAQRLLSNPVVPPDPDALAPWFEAADVPMGPWARYRETDPPEPPQPASGQAVLSDGDWVGLQGICRG